MTDKQTPTTGSGTRLERALLQRFADQEAGKVRPDGTRVPAKEAAK